MKNPRLGKRLPALIQSGRDRAETLSLFLSDRRLRPALAFHRSLDRMPSGDTSDANDNYPLHYLVFDVSPDPGGGALSAIDGRGGIISRRMCGAARG